MLIFYLDGHVLVANKPAGTPSEPDRTGRCDIGTLLSRELAVRGEKTTLFPVHRLDSGVGGLMAFARDRESAATLSGLMAAHGFTKEYFAVTEGVPPRPEGTLTDELVRDRVLSRARVVREKTPASKTATLSYRTLATAPTAKGTVALLAVTLGTGRFHQIRAQLSHMGTPVFADKKYGGKGSAPQIGLFCRRLAFSFGEKKIDFAALPETVLPWTLFPGILSEKSSDRKDLL